LFFADRFERVFQEQDPLMWVPSAAKHLGERPVLTVHPALVASDSRLLVSTEKETKVFCPSLVSVARRILVVPATRRSPSLVVGSARSSRRFVAWSRCRRAVLFRTPDFLALAGTIRVPVAKRNVAWDEVIRRTRSDRAATRR